MEEIETDGVGFEKYLKTVENLKLNRFGSDANSLELNLLLFLISCCPIHSGQIPFLDRPASNPSLPPPLPSLNIFARNDIWTSEVSSAAAAAIAGGNKEEDIWPVWHSKEDISPSFFYRCGRGDLCGPIEEGGGLS